MALAARLRDTNARIARVQINHEKHNLKMEALETERSQLTARRSVGGRDTHRVVVSRRAPRGVSLTIGFTSS
jgi:hypothetical protein